MIRYELIMLAIPEITSDESAALESQIAQILEQHKGRLISFEEWGKYRLAYVIDSKEYGVYFLVRFEAPSENINDLLSALRMLLAVKHTELVMRHGIFKLDPHASLSYHRPESLEETPSRDMETFLKESKMTGLLHQRGDRGRPFSRDRDTEKDQGDLAELDDLDDVMGTEA